MNRVYFVSEPVYKYTKETQIDKKEPFGVNNFQSEKRRRLITIKEIPEQVKLLKLSKMIWLREEERLGGKDNPEQLKEEFLRTLQSLSSLETVRKILPSLDLFFISR